MKKFTLLAAILLTATFSFAQITEGVIGQGSFTGWEGTTTCYGIDFNGDGNLEIAIKDGYDYNGTQCAKSSLEYNYEMIQIVTFGDYFDVLRLLNNGDVVNSSCQLGGYGDAFFENFNDVSTSASYVGFRWMNGGQYYYAYAKVHRSGNGIVWDKVYYNATANAAISAGATPTGIENYAAPTNAPTIRKVVIDGVLYIERGNELYELTGRRIK